MEISELDAIEQSSWEEKVKWLRDGGGMLALDDYDTTYNNEKTLLRVHPDFVKVDIAIVNDIGKNADKQQIMEYLVTYAHERKKCIIAEGVETLEEAQACISYGADYLQGFLFSCARKDPSPIDKRLSEMVKAFAKD